MACPKINFYFRVSSHDSDLIYERICPVEVRGAYRWLKRTINTINLFKALKRQIDASRRALAEEPRARDGSKKNQPMQIFDCKYYYVYTLIKCNKGVDGTIQ